MFDEAEFEKRLKLFTPEPLVPSPKIKNTPSEIPMVQEDANNIDLAKVNYLNMLNNYEVKKAAENCIRKYGVGSCGPRSFLGTSDLHEKSEEELAKFLQVPSCFIFPSGFTGITTIILSVCKEKDVIFISENSNPAVEYACSGSKSKIVKFAQNDYSDFESGIKKLLNSEKRNSRKYLILEAIYWNTGQLCLLPKFLEISEKYKIRVLLDETHSIGVLGSTGRGILEYYNIDSSRIDIIFGKLEGAFGSFGGFGANCQPLVTEAFRLNCPAYLFSASLPPLFLSSLIKAIELLQDKPLKFSAVAIAFHKFLKNDCKFNVVSHPNSPFQVVKVQSKNEEVRVHQYCQERGVHFLHNENGLVFNLNINMLEKKEKMERVCKVIKDASGLLK